MHWLLWVTVPGIGQLSGGGVHTGVQAGSAVHATVLVRLLHWLLCCTVPGRRQRERLGVHTGEQTGLAVHATALVLALHWFRCNTVPGLLQVEGVGVHTGIQAGSAVHATRCVVESHWLLWVTQDGRRQPEAGGVHVGTQIGLPVQATVCVALLHGLLWIRSWPMVQEFGSGVQSQVPGGAGRASPGSQTAGGQLFAIPAQTCNVGSTGSASQRFGGLATAHQPASVSGSALTRSSMSSIDWNSRAVLNGIGNPAPLSGLLYQSWKQPCAPALSTGLPLSPLVQITSGVVNELLLRRMAVS